MDRTHGTPARLKPLNAALLGALLAVVATQCTPRLLRHESSRTGRTGATFVMTRSGGPDGRELLLVVDEHGRYLVDRADGRPPAAGTLTPPDLVALARTLQAADLGHRRSAHGDHCADQHHYTFSYGRDYYATDDCPREPDVVGRVLRAVDPLVRAQDGTS
jgi:hypothetical protein